MANSSGDRSSMPDAVRIGAGSHSEASRDVAESGNLVRTGVSAYPAEVGAEVIGEQAEFTNHTAAVPTASSWCAPTPSPAQPATQV